MAYRFPKAGNPYYPLPPDYPELSQDGQRLARVNAVQLRETPEDHVNSWHFFREWYLRAEGAYFYDEFAESPQEHYEWAWSRGAYRRNAIAAHRGSAKSTIIGTEFPLLEMVAAPHSKTVMVLATDAKVEQRFDRIMFQLENNPAIVGDFGTLKPPKGDGIWNRHMLRLTNGAYLMGSSVQGHGIRGERPGLLIVDDPEYDPKEGTNMDRLIGDFDTLLRRVLLGMLRKRAVMFWIGTMVTKRSFLYKIVKGNDPRFPKAVWHTKNYAAYRADGSPMWAAEWDAETLRHKELELGSNFGGEMMGEPGSDESLSFHLEERKHAYRVLDGGDEGWRAHPLECPHKVIWNDVSRRNGLPSELVPREETASTLWSQMTRFITVDPAPTVKEGSDYSVVHVMGIDRLNQLWSLDMWTGKQPMAKLIDIAWMYAYRWRVRKLGVESVSFQQTYYNQTQDVVEAWIGKIGWAPQVVAIKPPAGVSKEDRIMGLEFRFEGGLLKLPWDRRHQGAYKDLFYQIEWFTPDGGHLEHDDAIDSLAMSTQMLPGSKPRVVSVSERESAEELLRRGQLELPGGLLAIHAISDNRLTGELVDRVRDSQGLNDVRVRGPGSSMEFGVAL